MFVKFLISLTAVFLTIQAQAIMPQPEADVNQLMDEYCVEDSVQMLEPSQKVTLEHALEYVTQELDSLNKANTSTKQALAQPITNPGIEASLITDMAKKGQQIHQWTMLKEQLESCLRR